MTTLQMLSAGIVPVDIYDDIPPMTSIKKMMNSLSEKERRIAARKFRKQWRKAYRKGSVEFSRGEEPTMGEARRRVWMVWQMFADKQIVPDD
jgi:hypothetical protein